MTDLSKLYAELDNNSDEPVAREDILKPLFGWTGGKSKSLKHILPLLPYDKGYVEVFGGSGCILMGRNKSRLEVFNDRNSGITDFYKCVRDPKHIDRLIERLNLSLHSREDWAFCKETWEDPTDPVERAARWYSMVEYSFSRLGRNFGRATSPKTSISGVILRKLPMFSKVHTRLNSVQIENQDWRRMLKDYDDPNTVFYLDPPYIDAYSGTYKYEMSPDDHQEMLETIMNMKAFVALSGYKNALMDSYDWDDCHSWEVAVTANAMAFTEENNKEHAEAKRPKAQECLWIKESS